MGNNSSNHATILQNMNNTDNTTETTNTVNPNSTDNTTNAVTTEIPNINDTNNTNNEFVPTIVIKSVDTVPTNTCVKKQPPFVHPFIAMINEQRSQPEMINTLQAFCGRTQIGVNEKNEPIYDTVDQMEFKAPVMQVFSYCANNGKDSVVEWLIENYIPLEVSYDNNFCYFECLKWKHEKIADMIVQHESFNPTMEILENLLERNKYLQFRHCMNSPYLRGDMLTYKFTFMHYIDNNQYSSVKNLLGKIKQHTSNANIPITDQVYPNPKLAKTHFDQIYPDPNIVNSDNMGTNTESNIVDSNNMDTNNTEPNIIDSNDMNTNVESNIIDNNNMDTSN